MLGYDGCGQIKFAPFNEIGIWVLCSCVDDFEENMASNVQLVIDHACRCGSCCSIIHFPLIIQLHYSIAVDVTMYFVAMKHKQNV